MNAKERSDFTQGSILKKMIPFMMPILGALILQAAYGAVGTNTPAPSTVAVIPSRG